MVACMTTIELGDVRPDDVDRHLALLTPRSERDSRPRPEQVLGDCRMVRIHPSI
jgi:hypothetical protein